MAEIKDTFVIINPNASKGRGEKKIGRIKACFEKNGIGADYFITTAAGDGEKAAYEACIKGYPTIIVCGGDGSINEAVNGVMRSGKDVAFGIIPTGRGNDFAWFAGIPTDIEDAVSLIVKSEPKRIDVGYLEGGNFPQGRYFLNGTGFGFEPAINFRAGDYKHLNGMPSYIVAFFHCLLHLPRPYELTMTVDGKDYHLSTQQVSVSNGRRMGSAFILTPNALLDDGLLDIVYACRPVNRRQVIPMVLSFFRGTQLEKCDFMKEVKGKEVIITSSEENMKIHTDGEMVALEAKSCLVRLLASALRLYKK